MLKLLAILVLLASHPQPLSTTGSVTLHCTHTFSASAGGTYGGVSFSIACRKSHTTTQTLTGLTSADYSVRVGAEGPVAIDAFYTGTAPNTETVAGTDGVTITFD